MNPVNDDELPLAVLAAGAAAAPALAPANVGAVANAGIGIAPVAPALVPAAAVAAAPAAAVPAPVVPAAVVPVAVAAPAAAVPAAGPVDLAAQILALQAHLTAAQARAQADRALIAALEARANVRPERPRPKRFPQPAPFVPPTTLNDDAVMAVEKYLTDLTNYVRYGVEDDIPPYVTFSQTSSNTYALVQEMAKANAASETAGNGALTVGQVCTMVRARYLPGVDLAQQARSRLLNHEVVQGPTESLGEYHARFMMEVNRGANDMAEADRVHLYRTGMLPDLRAACYSDLHANVLTSFAEVHRYALNAENRKRDLAQMSGGVIRNLGMNGNAKRPRTHEPNDRSAMLTDIVDCDGNALTVDAVNEHKRLGLCFNCSKHGHKIAQCPDPHYK